MTKPLKNVTVELSSVSNIAEGSGKGGIKQGGVESKKPGRRAATDTAFVEGDSGKTPERSSNSEGPSRRSVEGKW